MIRTSEGIKAISAALLQFQGSVDGVRKDSKNPAFKSNYASLEAVRDTAVPELQKVGVVFMQSAGAIVEGVMAMTTRLIHPESGEWIEGTMDIALGKRDPQGVGSASTYAARYSLMAMLGLPSIDDDGEGALDRNNTRPAPAELPKAKTRDLYAEMRDELDACQTMADLSTLWNSPAFKTELATLKQDWRDLLSEHKDTLKTAFTKAVVPPNFDGLEQRQ